MKHAHRINEKYKMKYYIEAEYEIFTMTLT